MCCYLFLLFLVLIGPRIMLCLPGIMPVKLFVSFLVFWTSRPCTWLLRSVGDGGHVGASTRNVQVLSYSSLELKTIRKSKPRERLDPDLWVRLGELGIRKPFRSRRKKLIGTGHVCIGPPVDTVTPTNQSQNTTPSASSWGTSKTSRIPSIIYTNIRALRHKMDELYAVMCKYA